ncbi:MAG: outer membrane beta-barrel protein [Prevotellaceae bacterium]|nr:outer membrane beta-barrel protein [Prevotellaceae bacterium]
MCIFFAGQLQAASIRGTLVDSRSGEPLIGSVVQVISVRDSTQRHYVTTAITGAFVVENLTAQSYRVEYAYLGYKKLSSTVALRDEDKNLGKIRLAAESIDLDAVQVTGNAARASQRGDTTEFNADAYKVSQDATTEDLLKKLPGVTVENGTVKTQGEDVKRVLVDGKPFFGDDPTIAIKNLPADAISRIEVYDRMSDQAQLTGFDDGNSEKTLNIVTREDRRMGQFGRLYGGVGQDVQEKVGEGDLRYSGGGNINLFSGERRFSVVGMSNNVNQRQFAEEDLVSSSGGGRRGGAYFGGGGSGIASTTAVGLNYSDNWGKKMEVTGSYFLNVSGNDAYNDRFRQYIVAGSDSMQRYNSTSNSETNNYNHRFNLRMEYKPNENTSLLYTPRLSFQDRNSESSSRSGMERFNSATSKNTSESNAFNFRNELLWRQKLSKPGRTFSAEVRYNINNSESESSRQSNTTSIGDTLILDQKSSNPTDNWSGSTRLIYTEPVSTNGLVQLSYDVNYSYGESNKKTYNRDSITQLYNGLDSLYSNIYDNDYLTQRVGLTYRYHTDKMNVMAGVNGETAILDGHQVLPVKPSVYKQFYRVLPNAMFEYKFTRQDALRIFYRSSTSAPSISQLQGVLDNTDPLFISSGNPNLKQTFSNNIFARYNKTTLESGLTFFSMLGYSNTNSSISNNAITNYSNKDTIVFSPADDSVRLSPGAQFSSPVNIDGNWSTWAQINFGLPLAFIKSNLNLSTRGGYSNNPGFVNGVKNIAKTYSVNQGVVLGSNISEKLDFTFSYNFTYNNTMNTLQSRKDNTYFQQVASGRVYAELWLGIAPQVVANYSLYSGLSEAYNQEYLRIDASIGKKFLKNNQGEIRLTVYDLLNQNKNVNRSITPSYIEDATSNVLTRYFLVTFIYRLKGQPPKRSEGEDGNRPRFRERGGFGGGRPM